MMSIKRVQILTLGKIIKTPIMEDHQ
ncbi:unnamed protein product [Acanthoscelides obtectus]|uniref:Uncharacterized protein n=1 Tax=Acanthoscelides obtectus TaxID=200917 RepID=A0A9P0QH09_ACAOB|nr:unnamed protein product [Acanthoscelides obtectus]CAK1683934.1 hypothetical protein AOBTE_LOCUS34530 [Acanthoscelides obtectus]